MHSSAVMRCGIIAVLLVCFGLLPKGQAVNPPPDGGYPGGNTAEGQNALLSLTSGTFNTAVGFLSLRNDTTGQFNTAVGAGALFANIGDPTSAAGVENTATGAGALLSNTTGFANTANGAFDLLANSTGSFNTATGVDALRSNTTGNSNTAIGVDALMNNIAGTNNTADGVSALSSNTMGGGNVAVGTGALFSNDFGNTNTAVGDSALANNLVSNNTAIGADAGFFATTGTGNVYIGAQMTGVGGESNHTYIRNINNTPVSGNGTDAVTVDLSTGLLGHASSSRRYKEDIKPMDNVSEALYGLHPVTFRYNKDIDRTQSIVFGLIAEEVAEVNPDLVARNSQGETESVHYEMVNAMLLNEFLKARRQIDAQQKQIDALTAGLQKVSAQLEASKPAPQVVTNP